MNSQANRKLKASSASTTRFMPARKAGIERQHALRRRARAGRSRARNRLAAGAAEIDDDEEERRERVEAEMRAEPGQAERQDRSLGRSLSK